MMDLRLKDNDLLISNGDISLCDTDSRALAQSITIRLKTLAGEWFLDEQLGIPYLSKILGRKNNHRFLKRLILKEIKKIPDVKEIDEFSLTEGREKRTIAINFQVTLFNQSTITIAESIGV